jgi:hypothetical protein
MRASPGAAAPRRGAGGPPPRRGPKRRAGSREAKPPGIRSTCATAAPLHALDGRCQDHRHGHAPPRTPCAEASREERAERQERGHGREKRLGQPVVGLGHELAPRAARSASTASLGMRREVVGISRVPRPPVAAPPP